MTLNITFAHLTDIHISLDGNHAFLVSDEVVDFFPEIIRHLNGLTALDFVFISGDCLNTAHDEELARFQKMIAPLQKPIYIVPGNHDGHILDEPHIFNQRHFAATFNPQYARRPAEGQAGYFSITIKPGIQFIGLDTAIPGAVGGVVDAPQMVWLEAELKAHADKLIIIGCHHPLHPLCEQDTTGKWLDWFVCANGSQVQTLLDAHPAVKLVLYGHHHIGKTFRPGGQVHMAMYALASYPCAYRVIHLNQADAVEDTWSVHWQAHHLPAVIQQKAAHLLGESDFAQDFCSQNGQAFVKLAKGNPLDWQFTGDLNEITNPAF